MKENREIVLSEQQIQDICKDFGKRLTEELKDEEKTPLFLGVMKGALNFMFDLIKRVDRPIYVVRPSLASSERWPGLFPHDKLRQQGVSLRTGTALYVCDDTVLWGGDPLLADGPRCYRAPSDTHSQMGRHRLLRPQHHWQQLSADRRLLAVRP